MPWSQCQLISTMRKDRQLRMPVLSLVLKFLGLSTSHLPPPSPTDWTRRRRRTSLSLILVVVLLMSLSWSLIMVFSRFWQPLEIPISEEKTSTSVLQSTSSRLSRRSTVSISRKIAVLSRNSSPRLRKPREIYRQFRMSRFILKVLLKALILKRT